MPKTEKRNILWIDCAKFLAIVAVVVDHSKGILYEGEAVQYAAFFSVAAFLFLAGMTSFYSLERRKEEETLPRWVGRRLVRILIPYLAAVAVYQYVKSGFLFSLAHFFIWAVHFNVEGSFYFVLIYLQLILAAPIVYQLTLFCRRGKWSFLCRGVYLAAAAAFSLLCMKHTFALETYGGGNYLFGGTYLFLFVMGMIAADMRIRLTSVKSAALASVLSVVVYGGALAFLLKDRLALDEALFGWTLRVNPPGITMIVYTLAFLFLIFSLCSLGALLGNRAADGVLGVLAWLGKYTLYIYLYHTIILDYLLPRLTFVSEMSFAKTAVYLAGMIGLPVAGRVLYDLLRRAIGRKVSEERLLNAPR